MSPPPERHPSPRYDEHFENSIVISFLNAPNPNNSTNESSAAESSTLTVNGPSHEHPNLQESDDVPSISHEELPLSLDDTRRKYPSPFPNIRLSRPDGSIHGGPKPPIAIDSDFLHGLISRYGIKSSAQLRRILAEERKRKEEELRRRIKERQKAIEENNEIENQISGMRDQRDRETNALRKMREDAERKRAERHKRRKTTHP